MTLNFTRGVNIIATVKATDNSYIVRNLMGDNTAHVEFLVTTAIAFKVGDRVSINGRYYFVKDQVIPVRDKSRLLYQMTLYGTMYELEKKIFFIQDNTGMGETATTSWDCTPAEFLQLLVDNMYDLQPDAGWTAGNAKEISPRTLSIDKYNCLEALQEAARLFECDYYVDEHRVHLVSAEEPAAPLLLEEGKSKGIREIRGNKSNDNAIVTRLYAYGSDKNSEDGQRLTIDPVDADNPDCLVEGIKEFDDIYPQVITTVHEQILGDDYAVIIADWIGFYIENYRIDGLIPKIRFITGELAGLEFTFSLTNSLDYAINYQMIGGVQVPGALGYNAKEDDEFEIINISMPTEYIQDAKDRLLSAALEYLAENKTQKLKLNITLDEFYLAQEGIQLEITNYITVKSTLTPWLATGVTVQVIGFKQFMNFPYRYDSLVVGDVSIPQSIAQIVKIVERQTIIKTTMVGGQSYRHSQITPATTWTCIHGLDKYPSVTVSDVSGNVVEPDNIEYQTKNRVVITFPVAFAGYADFN